jgi:hypothetical protein
MPQHTMATGLLDTRLRYRVGSTILRTLPLETTYAAFSEYTDLMPRVLQILKDEGVIVKDYEPCRRHYENEDADAIKSLKKTLLIESEISTEGQYSRWIESVQKIRGLFAEKKVSVDIEIIDTVAFRGPTSYPIIDGDEDAISDFATFEEEVLAAIMDQAWVSLDLLRRPDYFNPNSKIRPTIVIAATDSSNSQWWDRILPELELKCPSSLQIELLHCAGKTAFTADENELKNGAV